MKKFCLNKKEIAAFSADHDIPGDLTRFIYGGNNDTDPGDKPDDGPQPPEPMYPLPAPTIRPVPSVYCSAYCYTITSPSRV